MTEPLRRSKNKTKETLTDINEELLTRKQAKTKRKQLDEEFKTKRLAKRLNIVIVVLLLLIVLVYLFMFFVNF